MGDIAELHRDALAVTRLFVAKIGPDDWSLPTPCEQWTTRDVLNHVVSDNLWVVELVQGRRIEEVGDALDGDVLGDDPLRAYEQSAGAADAAFSAPGALDAPCHVSYGPISGSEFAAHRFVDVLIHGWDLAVATGQNATLPTELVQGCWEVIAPQADALRESGLFGNEVEVPDDADSQTRLLALLGREWTR